MCKKKIKEDDLISVNSLLGPIDDAIEFLNNMKLSGWEELESSGDCGYFMFIKYRLETDKEYDKRIKKQIRDRKRSKKQKEERLASERKLYQKLKRKFEQEREP